VSALPFGSAVAVALAKRERKKYNSILLEGMNGNVTLETRHNSTSAFFVAESRASHLWFIATVDAEFRLCIAVANQIFHHVDRRTTFTKYTHYKHSP